MNRLESLTAASSLLLVVCAPAAAQCIMPGSIDEEFAQATAVFDGTVSAVHYLPNTDCCHVYSGTVTFAVKRWWKGSGGGQFDLGAYGYIFDAGREYVVFASGTPPSASICSRAKPTSESADTVRWLSERPSRVADAASGPSAAILCRNPAEFKELPLASTTERYMHLTPAATKDAIRLLDDRDCDVELVKTRMRSRDDRSPARAARRVGSESYRNR